MLKSQVLHRTAVGVLLLGLATTAAASDIERFFSLDTFKANFTQRLYDDAGRLLESSKGKALLSRPGRFVWRYTAPEPYLIVSNGRHIAFYDPGLAQASIRSLTTALGAAPLGFLLNRNSLRRDFTVQRRPKQRGIAWTRLLPKTADSEFKYFDVGLGDGVLKEMMLFDQFDQRTHIVFSAIETDTDIAKGSFDFRFPKGTDIIKN